MTTHQLDDEVAQLAESTQFSPPRARATTLGKHRLSPLPSLVEVSYMEPLASKEGRRCSNCVRFYPKINRCQVHGADLPVTSDLMCNQHLGGKSSDAKKIYLWPQEFLKPHLSGLREVPARGAACLNCKNYTPGNPGYCNVTVQRGKTDAEIGKARVDKMGHCNRWTDRS